MRRLSGFSLGVALACLVIPATAFAGDQLKESLRAEGIRLHSPLGAPPVVRTISGSPLTVYVGDDLSFQVLNSSVPGVGQFYPTGGTCIPADAGVFMDAGGILYAPDFSDHPCGTATGGIGANTPWTPVSISAVTGTGSAADPFTVVVVADGGASGLRVTMTVTYVNGESLFRLSLAFSASDGIANFDVFLGGDLYLANDDDGIPFRDTMNNGVGGQNCGPAQTYTVLFIPTTPADAYSGNGYSTVWSQIGAASLPNTLAAGCLDNGAALEWSSRSAPTTIQAAVSFAGTIGPTPTPTIPQPAANVPTLSFPAMAVFGLGLAALGFWMMRRS